MQFGVNKHRWIFKRQQHRTSPKGKCNFSLQYYTTAYLQHIVLKTMLILVINLHEKSTTKTQDRQNFDSVHMLFVICSHVTTLHLCYRKNALVFSQSEVHKFLMSITTNMLVTWKQLFLSTSPAVQNFTVQSSRFSITDGLICSWPWAKSLPSFWSTMKYW